MKTCLILTRIWKLADICTWTYSPQSFFPSPTTVLMWSCALTQRRWGWGGGVAGEGKPLNKYFLFQKEEAVSLGKWGTFGLIRFSEIAVFGGKQTILIRDSPSQVIQLSFSIALNTTLEWGIGKKRHCVVPCKFSWQENRLSVLPINDKMIGSHTGYFRPLLIKSLRLFTSFCTRAMP